MYKVFDYKNNILNYTTKSGIVYNLQLRGAITIIDGEVASGKTYLANELRAMKSVPSSISGYDVSNIYVPSVRKEYFRLPDEDIEGLTIIDRADVLLNDELCEGIKAYKKMHFMIFLRKSMNIGYSPNYFGEFVRNDGVVTIKYDFSEELWF